MQISQILSSVISQFRPAKDNKYNNFSTYKIRNTLTLRKQVYIIGIGIVVRYQRTYYVCFFFQMRVSSVLNTFEINRKRKINLRLFSLCKTFNTTAEKDLFYKSSRNTQCIYVIVICLIYSTRQYKTTFCGNCNLLVLGVFFFFYLFIHFIGTSFCIRTIVLPQSYLNCSKLVFQALL